MLKKDLNESIGNTILENKLLHDDLKMPYRKTFSTGKFVSEVNDWKEKKNEKF